MYDFLFPEDERPPKSEDIQQVRKSLGLTQSDAAKLVYRTTRQWQKYESGEIPMDLAVWQLFLLKGTVLSVKREQGMA